MSLLNYLGSLLVVPLVQLLSIVFFEYFFKANDRKYDDNGQENNNFYDLDHFFEIHWLRKTAFSSQIYWNPDQWNIKVCIRGIKIL